MSLDHLTILNSILERFSCDNEKSRYKIISKLNVLNLEIEEIDTYNSIFVKENFFEEKVDKYIRNEVETQIGNLYKKIDTVANYQISHKENVLKTIFMIQYFRKNEYMNKMSKKNYNKMLKGIIMGIFDSDEFNDELDIISSNKILMNQYKESEKLYEEFTPGYLKLLNTSRTLMLPLEQFSYAIIQNIGYYIFPIAPTIALLWKRQKSEQKTIQQFVYENEAVENINKVIIDFGVKNKNYIFFGFREELEKMKSLYKK